MIASLTGVAQSVGLDRAVLDVSGVGFLVFATPDTLKNMRVGELCQVAVSMVVREDALTLYAFADTEERDVFDTARGVTGIGPRTALSLLAVHSPEDLRRAVHDQDAKAIQRVPGIGPKTAQRVLLELGDKLPPPSRTTATTGTAPTSSTIDERGQVVAALVSLGYQQKAAAQALETVLEDFGLTRVVPEAVPTMLRATLRAFGGKSTRNAANQGSGDG